MPRDTSMITITAATLGDSSTIAALWNVKRLDAASCWFGAEEIDDNYIAKLLSSGMTLALRELMACLSGLASGVHLETKPGSWPSPRTTRKCTTG